MAVLALALGACASSPTARTVEASRPDGRCLRQTGTRVELPEGKCTNAPGAVVTRESIDRGGGQTVGDALR